MLDYALYHKRFLPHIQPKGRPLFNTVRSSDPIPPKFMDEYIRYTDTLRLAEKQKPEDHELKATNNKKAFAFIDDIFHKSAGGIDFTKPEAIATMMSENLQALHGKLCFISAYTIMPNHLHILLRPFEREGKPISTAEIMKSFKGLSARQVNLILNRSGSLWYREYYDHWVRSGREFVNVVEYIRQNPVRAGLVKEPEEWKWTWLNLHEGEVMW